MKNKIWILFIGVFVLTWAYSALALTTAELVNLKKAGVSEEIVVLMAENNYQDTDKVLKLKEAGYKDESIIAIVKSEIKNRSLPVETNVTSMPMAPPASAEPKADFQTPAKVKIFRYLMYHDKPLLQNKEAIADAQVSILGKTLQITWEKKDGMNPLNAFQKEPFEPPFKLEFHENDVLGQGSEGYTYMLQTGLGDNHQVKMSREGYWVVYLEPKDQKLIDYIKNALKA